MKLSENDRFFGNIFGKLCLNLETKFGGNPLQTCFEPRYLKGLKPHLKTSCAVPYLPL